MYEELVALLLDQPFEKTIALATRQGITVHYDPKGTVYNCKYWHNATETTFPGYSRIQLSIANTILDKLLVESKIS